MPLSNDIAGQPINAPGPISIRRADRSGRVEAINVLLTGRAKAGGVMAAGCGELTSDPYFSWDHLWAAYEGDSPRAAALILPTAGRTAMFFVSPVWERSQVAVTAALAQAVCEAQDPVAIRMIQALLNPEDRLAAQALAGGGFVKLAILSYMHAAAKTGDSLSPLDQRQRLVAWGDGREALFRQAILDSYEDTLDCPALKGLRSIDDIVAGHMGVGQFDPGLWFVLTHVDEPIAVLLLNAIPDRHLIELVYLGIHRRWRRKGIGRWLVRFALSTALAHHASGVMLAVDESNTPALRLYQSAGFVPTTRKLAMIFTLPERPLVESPSYPPVAPRLGS